MISSKRVIQGILAFCKANEIRDWYFSPGSRNAPFSISVPSDEFFNAISIVDESSAGFIALGSSLNTNNVSVLCCTSGTAPLKYASAIAEAYYQRIPLLIITADRPQHWIGHGEGQSIKQVGVFDNYVKQSFHLDDFANDSEISETLREVEESLFSGEYGPVHLNVSFEEPLYEQIAASDFKWEPQSRNLDQPVIDDSLAQEWNSFEKILVLVGQENKKTKYKRLLDELSLDPRVVIMTEHLSNHAQFGFVNCIDRTLARIEKENSEYQPELVITLGEAIVSKKIKQYLRSIYSLTHWHHNRIGRAVNVFKKLTKVLDFSVAEIESKLKPLTEASSTFRDLWKQKSFEVEMLHQKFVQQLEWCDLKAHGIIYDTIPHNAVLHLGNSSVVRYNLLFNPSQDIFYLGNRGVSGIDGSTSTAVGYASKSSRLNVLVSGDLSFGYDANAFWNKLKVNNLKTIVINNGGGGIFRIIQGPKESGNLKDFFEVETPYDLKKRCESQSLRYLSATDVDSLEQSLIKLYESNESTVLEIQTPGDKNDLILKDYFKFLNQESL